MEAKRQIPIKAGLFKVNSDGVALVGSKCRDCGKIAFPQRSICPVCFNQSLEEVMLSTRGKVESCTILKYNRRLPPGYTGGKVPYAFGHVILPEGTGVQTDFSGFDMQTPLTRGTEVELGLRKFREDDEGNEVLTYTFRPVGSEK